VRLDRPSSLPEAEIGLQNTGKSGFIYPPFADILK